MASDSSPGSLKELATSRARFIAELGERIVSIRQGLARVGASAEVGGELNAVRRRLHALAAAADVLHFTAAADALGRAEAELGSVAGAPSAAPVRERVSRILDLLPSLALGAAVDLSAELDGERTRSAREPLSVLIFGDVALEAALHKPGPLHGVETHATRDLDQLLTLVARLGPDVLLIDGDDEGVMDLLPRLRQAAGFHPFSIVAVGNFEAYDAMLRLVRRGIARVLPKPVDAAALQRTLSKLVPRESLPVLRDNPFERIEPAALVEVISSEARKAFVGAHASSPPTVTGPLGVDAGHRALAALWSAFARIRALAAQASEGAARFPLEGPHGMIPLAPTLADAQSPSPHDSSVSELLAGRRFVVADADPTLLGALSRSLQRLGASVLPARDGAQALELCERQWPDAVIADALLPAIGGFELCRRIREDIALAELPVALICWKEHLLEHARRVTEQHAGEARPLDPESFAPLGEALQKRAALERRLERHDAVQGRLDGLTPRLLLQLACSRPPSALLSLRAGRLVVEVAVVDGRPVHARLLDNGAIAAEGAAALGPFLGMRVGRFSLEPLSTAPAPCFSGDVMTVLAPAIARARRASAWLSSPRALELERVEVEPRVAVLYADEAPAAHKALLSRLLRGESPRQLAELAEAGEAGDASQLVTLLLELARRGGLLALIDPAGRDVLGPDAARAPQSQRSQRGDAPAVVLPAALSLAEAVLQAVSAPAEPTSDKPSARRTHPGLAPPSPPVESYRSRPASTPPLPGAESLDTKAAPPNPSTAEPREVPEAWSSEPDEEIEAPASDSGAPGHALDEEPPASGGRVRAVAGPVLVTLGAAALAFAGMRVILGGALEGTAATPSTEILGNLAAADSGSEGPATPEQAAAPAPPAETTDPASAGANAAPPLAPDAGDAAGPRAGSATAGDAVPLDVNVSTELLDAPPLPTLPPGHGLLEVRTWEPQRIYVDGVFVGNYASRLVPLSPGAYRVRLSAGARDIERAVQVEAGRLTRLSASSKISGSDAPAE